MPMTYEWTCGKRTLPPGPRTLLMGILNVTPDSFYDGGRHQDPAAAVDRGLELFAQGADIVDVGGESTRPGADPIPAEEEKRRVVPVIRRLADQAGERLVSVDTTKAAVARAAIEAGAVIVNDVSGLTLDPAMPSLAAETGVGVVVMHRQGTPRTMQDRPRYEDVTAEVLAFLRTRLDRLEQEGLDRRAIAVDPGFGFGKTDRHNASLLRSLASFHAMGRPVVAGWSRKSTLGRWTGRPADGRLAASLAALSAAVLHGANVVRVHDVAESADALAVLDRFLGEVD